MNATDEATAILTRVFEALARANGKTLNRARAPTLHAPAICTAWLRQPRKVSHRRKTTKNDRPDTAPAAALTACIWPCCV